MGRECANSSHIVDLGTGYVAKFAKLFAQSLIVNFILQVLDIEVDSLVLAVTLHLLSLKPEERGRRREGEGGMRGKGREEEGWEGEGEGGGCVHIFH